MNDTDLPEQPEPQTDPPPEEGPGGPADVVHRDEDDLPPATPDQPRSAQVEEEHVPDEIDQPEDKDSDVDEETKDTEDATDEADEPA